MIPLKRTQRNTNIESLYSYGYPGTSRDSLCLPYPWFFPYLTESPYLFTSLCDLLLKASLYAPLSVRYRSDSRLVKDDLERTPCLVGPLVG